MDPQIVLSLVNARLRNRGKTIDDLCEEMAVDRPLLDALLARIGYRYDPILSHYIPVETKAVS